jgi:hypothetical protein
VLHGVRCMVCGGGAREVYTSVNDLMSMAQCAILVMRQVRHRRFMIMVALVAYVFYFPVLELLVMELKVGGS